MKQKTLGQFFTNKNIFKNKFFLSWFKNIPIAKRHCIVEPFAGKNGLVDMLVDLSLINQFQSFDIEPQNEHVLTNDSILNFPKGFSVCITNPPFLAKNIATRKNITANISPFSDLYEKCLDVCLNNCEYVAVIVPESFIVSPFFKTRLYGVISLTQKSLFNQTEHPVCLALFNPENSDDFNVYRDNILLGRFHEKKEELTTIYPLTINDKILFHKPNGQLGLINIDATDINKKVSFCDGENILKSDVGYHSRLRTRIDILTPDNKKLSSTQLKSIINICNKVLNDYRKTTQDIFLTSFKGLRTDSRYRRRLDYSTARLIVSKAYSIYFKK